MPYVKGAFISVGNQPSSGCFDAPSLRLEMDIETIGNCLTLALERDFLDKQRGVVDRRQNGKRDPMEDAWLANLAEAQFAEDMGLEQDFGTDIRIHDFTIWTGVTVDVKSTLGRTLHVPEWKNCPEKRCDIYVLYQVRAADDTRGIDDIRCVGWIPEWELFSNDPIDSTDPTKPKQYVASEDKLRPFNLDALK